MAALNGYMDITQFFISNQNCDPNILVKNGKTPLHCAVHLDHLHIVKYLIDEQGCNPSCLDKHKCTLLHYAAMQGHLDIVKFLTVEKHCDSVLQTQNVILLFTVQFRVVTCK